MPDWFDSRRLHQTHLSDLHSRTLALGRIVRAPDGI